MLTAEDAIIQLLQEQEPGKSISLSQAAQRMDAANPKSQMEKIRKSARRLHDREIIEIIRKGKPVDPHNVKGVVRYRLKPVIQDDSNI